MTGNGDVRKRVPRPVSSIEHLGARCALTVSVMNGVPGGARANYLSCLAESCPIIP
jgi:hypothetical protein